MKFQGKKVLVTGGGGGMGRAIAMEFALEGADIAILDMVAENAERVAGEVRSAGRQAIALKVDVAGYQAVKDTVAKALQEFKTIDVLINGAGYAQYAPFTDLTEETWDRSIDTHLKGTFNVTQAVIPGMFSGAAAASSAFPRLQGSPVPPKAATIRRPKPVSSA